MIISKTKLIIFSILTVVCLFSFVSIGYADEISDKRIEQTIIEQDILQTQQQLDVLSNQYAEAIIKKDTLEKEITDTEKQIKDIEKELNKNKEQLTQQAVHTYKNGSISWLDVILDSNSFNEFNNNLDYCSKIINSSNMLIEQNSKLRDDLLLKQTELQQQQEELKKEIENINQAKAAADLSIQNLQQEYLQLDIDIAQLSVQNVVYSTPFSEEELKEVIATVKAENPHMTDGDVVSRAYAMLGSPYAWGGTTSAGFDCSGFVSYCLTGEEGTRLGTTNTFMGWNQTNDPQPGDICVNDGHTGIYVGDGRMIHASTYGVGVVESDVQDGMIFVTYN